MSKRSEFIERKKLLREYQLTCEQIGKSIDLTEISESEVASKGHVWKLCGFYEVANYQANQPGVWVPVTVDIIVALAIGPHLLQPPMPFGSSFYNHANTLLSGLSVGDEILLDFSGTQGTEPPLTPGGLPNTNAGNQIPSAICMTSTIPGATFPGAPTGIGSMLCFKYLGLHDLPLTPTSNPTQITTPFGNYSWSGIGMIILPYTNLVYNISKQKCCDEGFVPPREPTRLNVSWDCVPIGDHPKFGSKCVRRNHGNGQFLTLQDCIDLPCSQEAPQLPIIDSLSGLQSPLAPPPDEPEEETPPPSRGDTEY